MSAIRLQLLITFVNHRLVFGVAGDFYAVLLSIFHQ